MNTEKNQGWGYLSHQHTLIQTESDQPVPEENQILVRNAAIGINPVDWKFIKTNPLHWPDGHIPGVDGAGVVVAVGKKVSQDWIGERVAYHQALAHNGSFGLYTRLFPERVMKLPETLSFAMAAALPCPMLTARQAFEKIPLRKEFPVLVVGLGAVNKLLVQMLVQADFRVDVLSKNISEAEAQSYGIRNILRFPAEIKQPYFAIYDAISGAHAAEMVPHLKANGHIICIQDRIPAL
ncbi:alcohol dehydrogenase catalytic domain-containing protein [Persicobacter sp. CCB-QB2]|uniref:alcohol dehydrogenase catalytic domain-containing protein n=1 Tax=Persicobacter sp. CCB-QB2 TaxID=1561025 RepID=UPI000B1C7515|nr:alcohol dehydrogenase catalytic domain-containing protein [Persicobacter sp. CCB-QB2]